MANVDKFTRAATGHLCAHFERAKDENGEYINFGNQNITRDKTHLNYNLAPDHEGGQVEFIQKRTSEIKCLKRADVNVMCSWIVTLPQEFGRVKEFFEKTYNFLSERYKEENVVSAYVHMDEKQPHMHFSFVPVVVGKNGKEKVSAKELLTKTELQRFHPELQHALEHALGQEVPILNGATAGGNRTVAELKAAQEAVEAAGRAETIKSEVEALQGKKNALQGNIDALESRLLSAKEVAALNGKKTLTGALKGVSYEDYEALKRTAKRIDTVDAERNRAIKRAEVAEKQAAAASQKAKDAMTETPSMKMQMENATLKARLRRVESWLQKLMEHIPEQLRVVIDNILRDRDPFRQQKRNRQMDMGR